MAQGQNRSRIWLLLALVGLALTVCGIAAVILLTGGGPEKAPATREVELESERGSLTLRSTPIPEGDGEGEAEEATEQAVAELAGIEWGPAGVAPQSLGEAITELGMERGEGYLLTPLYPEPGNDMVIGWIVGTGGTEAASQTFMANIDRGLCLDFDPGVTVFTGGYDWTVAYTDHWTRGLVNRAGSIESLKVTVYWTPCQKTATEVVSSSPVIPASLATPATSVPTPASAPTNPCPVFDGRQTEQLPDGGCKLAWVGTIHKAAVPDGWMALYWDGSATQRAQPGQEISTGELTLYPVE